MHRRTASFRTCGGTINDYTSSTGSYTTWNYNDDDLGYNINNKNIHSQSGLLRARDYLFGLVFTNDSVFAERKRTDD